MNLLPQPHHALAHLYTRHERFTLVCRAVASPHLDRPIARFMPGQTYAFTCDRLGLEWRETRHSMRNVPEVITLEGSEICFTTHDDDGVEWTFREGRMDAEGRARQSLRAEDECELSLHDLLNIFTVPPAPDIVDAAPAVYADACRQLQSLLTHHSSLAASPIKLRPFQAEDLARLSLCDGAILGWEQGLGKSLAAFLWPLLKCGPAPSCHSLGGAHGLTRPTTVADPFRTPPSAFRILIVAPAGLHDQLIKDGLNLLGIPMRNAECGLRNEQPATPHSALRTPHFFIASFEETIRAGDAWRHAWDCIVVDEGVRLKSSDSLTAEAIRNLDPPFRLILTGTPLKNKLADLFPLCWWACQRDADWAARTGYGFQRWTFHERYQDGPMFPQKFLVSRRNLTRERATGQSCTGWTNAVQNIHDLWTLLGPILLRRTKEGLRSGQWSVVSGQWNGATASPKPATDNSQLTTDKLLVSKHRHLIRVPMSPAQQESTAEILARAEDPTAILNALRQAAIIPMRSATVPGRSKFNLPVASSPAAPETGALRSSPKLALALDLARRFVAEGRAVLIFSPFLDPLDALSDLLTAAGLPHLVCDGRLSPQQRAESARQFAGCQSSVVSSQLPRATDAPRLPATDNPPRTTDQVPLLLACSESMSEGYNFPRCSRIIHLGLPWAMDTLLQSEDRGWRLNSLEDLHVYRILSQDSIDELMEKQMIEKNATADLVIDGQIRPTPALPATAADLLAALRAGPERK